jgi:hypothetical protein
MRPAFGASAAILGPNEISCLTEIGTSAINCLLLCIKKSNRACRRDDVTKVVGGKGTRSELETTGIRFLLTCHTKVQEPH